MVTTSAPPSPEFGKHIRTILGLRDDCLKDKLKLFAQNTRDGPIVKQLRSRLSTRRRNATRAVAEDANEDSDVEAMDTTAAASTAGATASATGQQERVLKRAPSGAVIKKKKAQKKT